MYTRSIDLGDVRVFVIYSKDKSPLNISLTASGEQEPSYGAMAFAIPSSSGTPSTSLVQDESFNDSVQNLAKAFAQRYQRPTFVNSSIHGDPSVVRQVFDEIDHLLSDDDK